MKKIIAKLDAIDKSHITHDFVNDINFGLDGLLGRLLGASFVDSGATFSDQGNVYFNRYRLSNNGTIKLESKYKKRERLELKIILSDGAEKLWTPDSPFYSQATDYLHSRNMAVR